MKKIQTLKFTLFACLLGAAMMPMTASAGLFDDDEARKAILDLRTKIDSVSAALDAKLNGKLENKADNGSILELASQIEQQRTEIAKLRGQIEVLSNDVSNLQRRQQDLYVDLDNRLRKLEPQKVSVDGQELTVENAEKRAYDAATALFKEENYKEAGAAFVAFNVNYPQSAYASSAQYWLGASYFAQRECKNTISTLSALVKNYPDYIKAPDAMLNIASCQLDLKDKLGSRKTLEKILARYPETEEAKTAKNLLAHNKK